MEKSESKSSNRATPKIFESEYRMCLILWESEPLKAADLARLCNARLGWSRTTTYTVIHRLEERGILQVKDSVVSSLVSKEQAQRAEMDELLEKTFEGSIPAFMAAFVGNRTLSEKELREIRRLLDEAD